MAHSRAPNRADVPAGDGIGIPGVSRPGSPFPFEGKIAQMTHTVEDHYDGPEAEF